MNAKRAKKLRRVCKELVEQEIVLSSTKNTPEEVKTKLTTFMQTDYNENEKNRKMHTEYEMEGGDFKLNENGERIVKDRFPTCLGTLKVKETCFRGLYHKMKSAIA